MKNLVTAVAGIALGIVAAGPSNAAPMISRSFHTLRSAPPVVRPFSRSRFAWTAPKGCDTNTTPDFVGIAGVGDIAGPYAGVAGGGTNKACDYYDGIGAGQSNVIGGDGNGTASYLGAGLYNEILGANSFIGAGYSNNVAGSDAGIGSSSFGYVSGNGSFIAAGDYMYATQKNTPTLPGNQIAGTDSFIGAGDSNILSGNGAFIGAGQSNTITSAGSYGAVLGGYKNVVSNSYSEVLGGYGSTASGEYAMVLGGNSDTAAGTLSLAAGYHADAVNAGSFVWSDYVSGSAFAKDTAINQFVVRASGGTTVYSNEAMSAGVKLTAGSGAWASLSDRNSKTAVEGINDDSILAKVAVLPIDAWSYRSETGVRHVGPMAQDFYAAFGTGVDDRHITSIDEDGVALASIKSLNTKLVKKTAEIASLTSRLISIEAKNASLERRLDAIEARIR